jgi:hypothetical protein
MDVSEGLNIGEPLDISTVVFEPNGSVKGHLIVLIDPKLTI